MVRAIYLLTLVTFVVFTAGCAAPGHRFDDPRYAGETTPVSDQRNTLLLQAMNQLGVPYRYGGTDSRGFDCSGLVQFVHRRVGVAVPRTAAQQLQYARTVPVRSLRTGDLVFFRIEGGKSRHVGIYEGRGRFIHAPSGGKSVSRASLDNPYWRRRLISAGTFL